MSSEIKQTIKELWKAGLKKEAKALLRIARGMTNDEQRRHINIFADALHDQGLGPEAHLQVDPKTKIVTFQADGFSLVQFPEFLDRLLQTVNQSGNYKLRDVKRGPHTIVRISIG